MLYMVIEQYKQGPGPIYERASIRGRMLPSGLHYLDSWVVNDEKMETCFQLMETDDPELLQVWRNRWEDLVAFEIKPVITSEEASARSRTVAMNSAASAPKTNTSPAPTTRGGADA